MHIISGELRKPPYVKPNVGQNGESTLFIVELSEVIKDRQTGEKTYTNYSAALFAKGGQIAFYQTALVEGNFIVVTGEKIKIKVSECGQYTKLELENARLENSKYIESNGQAQGGGFQQQAPQQQQQAPQQNGGFSQPMNQGQAPQQHAHQQQGGYAPQVQQQYIQQSQQQQAPMNQQQPADDDIPF